jgi:hypothetical protein
MVTIPPAAQSQSEQGEENHRGEQHIWGYLVDPADISQDHKGLMPIVFKACQSDKIPAPRRCRS